VKAWVGHKRNEQGVLGLQNPTEEDLDELT